MCKNCIYANEYGDCTYHGPECIQEAARTEERRLQEGGHRTVTKDGHDYEYVDYLGQYAVYKHNTKSLVGYDTLPQ